MPPEGFAAADVADAGTTIVELRRQLAEAYRREEAIAQVLRAITQSSDELQPVLNVIAETAARICRADSAHVFALERGKCRLVASNRADREFVGYLADNPIEPGQAGSAVGRAVLERRTIHIPDATKEPLYGSGPIGLGKNRTVLAVPLLREDTVIGAMAVARRIVEPFSDKEIELVTAFGDQAVIANEGVRKNEAEKTRSRELSESLEYQTATADVLGVMARSRFALQPVVDAIVKAALRLCRADRGALFRLEQGGFRLLPSSPGNMPEVVNAGLRERLIPIDRGSIAGRVALAGQTVHVLDFQADPDFVLMRGSEGDTRRTCLGVPLIGSNGLLGALIFQRTQVQPFTEKQIALVETFADQAVIAIENTRLFEEVQARTRELTEALEYQTATSEVLGVISRSPNELRPVLETIVEIAARLCNADYSQIMRASEDGTWYAAALFGHSAEYTEYLRHLKVEPGRGSITGRVLLEGRATQIPDVTSDPDYELHEAQRLAGYRTHLGVPLSRKGHTVGMIILSRKRVSPFSTKEIELVETFADQAIIAIENTRLFEEVKARTGELQEALEYQTAISEVLGVISQSPTSVQPVFDTIAASALRLCGAKWSVVTRFDGQLLHLESHHNLSDPGAVDAVRRLFPRPLTRGGPTDRAIISGRVSHVPDVLEDPEYTFQTFSREAGYRSHLSVPMVRDGQALGAITVAGQFPGAFSDRQVRLLQAFANQAVIAIENTRLFEEVQARNAELRVALEQQTATSELLKVIGRSTFDLKPVFEMLIESAVKLCGATRGFVSRFDGKVLLFAAGYNVTPELKQYFEENPFTIDRHSNTGRAAIERRTIHNIDVQSDPEYTYGGSRVDPYRTVLAIPMLRADYLLGVILIYRHEVQPFTTSQITLIETFADQAVIAIENTRLFEEVQARNRDLTALSEVGRAVTSTLDLRVVLKTIVDRAVELSGTEGGSIFYFRNGCFELGETTGLNEQVVARYRTLDIAAGQTGLGHAIARCEPLQLPDILERPSNPLRDAAIEAGFRAALIVPLQSGDGPLGALVLQRRRPGDFPPAVINLMQSFADQSAIALENAHLFDEIAQKSRELEIASQHKSQFVANMSHELRTPLAAILGYAELMHEGFYEPLGQKSLDALTRIRSNGKHLLGLINTVLDIAKIESGQFTLNMAEYAIESVVETVRSATESLAQAKKLALKTEVAKPIPVGLGDEQRLTQVLLNLVGNAIKFTETGEVCVTAKAVEGHFAVSVADTGPGIPEHERARIFEQFHQIDNSNTKAKGGTGLGLAIAKQIVEMHGGRIWVESTLGMGSTFQMELPTRAEFRKRAT